MADDRELTQLLSAEKFARIERAFRKHFQLGLETAGADGLVVAGRCSTDCQPGFCRQVQGGAAGEHRCIVERRRAVKMAAETGQSFITICHAGIVLVCVPVVDTDRVYGGMFFGKCLWEPVTLMLVRDIERRLRGLEIDPVGIDAALAHLPVIQGRQIHNAAEFLFDLLYEVGGFDARVIRWRRQRSRQQSEIGEFIQQRKKLGAAWQYPLQSERALLQKVKIGDPGEPGGQGDSQFHSRHDPV